MLRHICRLLGWEGRNAFVKLARRSPEQRYPWQQKGSGELTVLFHLVLYSRLTQQTFQAFFAYSQGKSGNT